MAGSRGNASGYKMLVLDIDGTLLTSQATISPATIDALRRARDHGLGATLATGRRLATVEPLCRELGVTLPVILQSGAQIVDAGTNDVLYSNPLTSGDVAAAIQLILDGNLQPILYENRASDQHLLIGPERRDSEPTRRYAAGRPDLVRRLSYQELGLIADPLEVAAIDELDAIKPVAARTRLANCRHLISYSVALDSYFLEIFHATTSKGEALRHLTGHIGISMNEVIAIGDNYNDREMLQAAGLGVAMGNAEPEIIAIADRVTRSNDEDGIAAFIDALLSGT